jgi:hypothetical protein
MKTQVKFHIIAISAISIIVTVLYMWMKPAGPTDGASAPENGQQVIEIHSATWGRECNAAIAQAQRERETTPLPAKSADNPPPTEAMEPVQTDNVLPKLKDICNGKSICELRASSDVLGTAAMQHCFKRLIISYRCFSTDRLTTLEVGQGERFKIDCHETVTSQPPHHATTQ